MPRVFGGRDPMQPRQKPGDLLAHPTRISRSLAVAVGVVVGGGLLLGGTSLALARRIFQNNEAVSKEYGDILKLDRVHSVFDDLIFELHQLDSTGRVHRATDALLAQEDIVRRLDALGEAHPAWGGGVEQEQTQRALVDLRKLAGEARDVTRRLAGGDGHLAGSDIEWIDRATHEVPRRTGELAEFHRARITSLLANSRSWIFAIVVLYEAFILIGGVLVGVAAIAANRGIAVPLGRLVAAAREIADGHLDARVPILQSNEIGQLSEAFNVMASRIQTRENELRRAHDALGEKVRETRALYRIGTEISRLHQLDRILQSVVDKARELLRGDAGVLCLFASRNGDLVAQATSGPPEAFYQEGGAAEGEPRTEGGPAAKGAAAHAVSPGYAHAHLATPIRLGDDEIGAIHVYGREAREFTETEAELLAGLATQVAIAVEWARLSAEVRSLAAVEERERIAREMHDGLAQALGLLHLKLHGALARTTDSPVVTSLREMVRITDHAYEDVRQSIFGLRTFVSRGLGLVPTLAEYLHEYSAQNGIIVELEVAEGRFDPMPPASEVQAVRIIQEALTNVRKHARAHHAWVRLQRDGAWVRVAIEDDGVGWDPRELPDRSHFGLQTMRERAEGVGGRLEVDAAPGRGTRVLATLPGVSA